MIRNISIGIDVGTSMTRVVVGEFIKGEKNPKILGIGEAPSLGLRHGYITTEKEASESIKKAVALAEHTSGIKIKRAFIGINTVTLRGDVSSGNTIISKADGEVTALDINKAIEDSENNLNLGNRKIIQIFPISFKLDGKEILGRPEGMRGTKLEVKTLFLTCLNQHLEDLLSAVAEAGIEPIDIIASPVAGAMIALGERQKIVGSMLVNIGSETVSLVVFENGLPISVHTFSIGSSDITNDIALGLKISLEEADKLKLGTVPEKYSKKKLDEIIEARLIDIFELIGNHLKKIKRNELLPAGIVFIGGGAFTPKLEELSRSELSLPSRTGSSDIFGNAKTKLKDPTWFTALGLVLYKRDNIGYQESSSGGLLKDLKNTIKSITRQFLP
jgi:cell division protein FtsA